MNAESERFQRDSDKLVALARDIKILSALSWPIDVQETFLKRWRQKRAALPIVDYPPVDLRDSGNALDELAAAQPREHAVGVYLAQTASSYATACRLIGARGRSSLMEHSTALYGRPGDPLPGGQGVNNLDAARHFIKVAEEYADEVALHEDDYCLSAEVLRIEMESHLGQVFTDDPISVVIDPGMTAKAAAGATRIRLRGGTCFSEYDLQQLLQHEAFVHSLTAINGRRQPRLTALGLGAPRTTATQEGLATFAELITGAIDIARMKRISLRIIAIDMALAGADFIEVFKYFLEQDQSPAESFNSSQRVFRGAPLTGGTAFTKDTVYLQGLMEIHSFFRWCLTHRSLKLCRHLFAGRMSLDDVVALEPHIESGLIAAPRYLPPWMTRTNGLAGYLAFSVFANKIRLESLEGTRMRGAVRATSPVPA